MENISFEKLFILNVMIQQGIFKNLFLKMEIYIFCDCEVAFKSLCRILLSIVYALLSTGNIPLSESTIIRRDFC